MKKYILIALVVVVALPLMLALDKPLRRLRNDTVTCTTTPALVQPATSFITSRPRSMLLINPSATAVFFGESDVDGSTAGNRGTSVCSSGCDWSVKWNPDVQEMYCYAGSSTQVEIIWGE